MFLSRSHTLPQTMRLNSSSASTDSEKATLFNHYFHSVFTSSSYTLPPVSSLPEPSSSLNDLHITESDTFEALNSIDPSKAPDSDNIGPNLLKHCAIALYGPLHHLFTQCLIQHNIPSEWRIHQITPIHKSGDKAIISNYRPISLLSCTSKVLERIIYDKIINFITSTISDHQFGFLRCRSSTQQLLIFLNTIYDSLNRKSSTDVIYLDLREAFDTISHPELLHKLWLSGITGNLWMWFRSYLSERQQLVSINNHKSDLLPVLSGVPQGSIFGSLLFIIYINDLPSTINHSLPLLFADDTKCLANVNSPISSFLLQKDLNSISSWAIQWNMSFNEAKCVHLHFSSDTSSDLQYSYFLNNSLISPANSHKDLGVTLSSDLTWTKHYRHITSSAYRSLGLIRRSFKTNSISAKRQLYLSLVRSHLSYCSPVWRPYLIKDIILLERVQERATKYILNDYTSSYKYHLKALHILPLMYYFELIDITFFVNSLKNPDSYFNINDYVTFSDSNTRSSSFNKLKHNESSSNSARHLFFNRLPHLWNSLAPVDLDSSTESIKSTINKHLWSHFDHHFSSSNPYTYHYKCPCSNCLTSFQASIYA